MHIEYLILGALALLTLGGSWAYLRSRSRREAADTETLALAHAEGRNIPPTLHPIINPDLCMGSLSCLAVCPEGDVLGVVDGKAVLIDPAACIGHGKCALECPVNAITLVFGTSQRGVDLPEVNEFFETSRAGVHIVGELGGMGLIKNAITQGLQVATHLAEALPAARGTEVVDVVVVGAGPAGLATALGLTHQKRSIRLLEQESVGGTIAHYPRQKVVMTERVELPFYGKFGKALISKEELLESWQEAIDASGIRVETGVKVEGIEGADGNFIVATNKGPVRARKVVLAVGRRGSPRKMGVPGEDLPKVTYRLIDASQYEGARVLVVGGGDAALEAAIQIAQETDAEVALSYRQPELGRARDSNKKQFRALVDEGRIFPFMPSQVKRVTPDEVHLSSGEQVIAIPNDFVIACLGGELPTEFLAKNGIGLTRLHGETMGKKAGRGSALDDKEVRTSRRLAFGLFILGAIIVAVLAVVGSDYYHLPLKLRLKHPAHAVLKPAGIWGHGVGIVATGFMMLNFVYALRKRWRRMKGFSTIRRWLTFHQFVGFMSPLVIAFHAAFQSNNMLASLTAGFLGVVVATGVVGRFFYAVVPGGDGHQAELGDLAKRWERLRARVSHDLESLSDVGDAEAVLAEAARPIPKQALLVFLATWPWRALEDFMRLWSVRSQFATRDEFRDFRDAFKRMRRLQAQVGFFRGLKRIMSVWRILHVVLAIVLVVLIAGHIGVSLYLGYAWIFT